MHENGPDGKISERGLKLLEAFIYAVTKINKNKNILPHLTLGYLVTDGFSNADTSSMHATAVLGRGLHMYLKDYHIDGHTSLIGALLTGGPNDVTIATKKVTMTKPDLIHVDFESHYSSLFKDSHTNFLATSFSVEKEIIVLATFLHKNQWNHVSVLYSETVSNVDALSIAKRVLGEIGICVAYQKRIHDKTNFLEVTNDLLSMQEYGVSNVIVFLSQSEIKNLLNIYSLHILKNPQIGNRMLRFISLGRAFESTNRQYGLLPNAFIEIIPRSSHNPRVNYSTLWSYFNTLSSNKLRNPWFDEKVWQVGMNDIEGQSDIIIKSMLHSVWALAKSLHELLQSLDCLPIDGLCKRFTELESRGEWLKEVMEEVLKTSAEVLNTSAQPQIFLVKYSNGNTSNEVRYAILNTHILLHKMSLYQKAYTWLCTSYLY